MDFQAFSSPPPPTLPSAAAPPRSTPRRSVDDTFPDVDSLRKTKQRKRVLSDEEDFLAGCLVMLSRGGADAPETAPADQNNHYECGVCGKVFKSYQALGGHKTRHRNKSSPAAACEESTDLDPNRRVYECAICHKSFRMAQALGGHKRKHYKGVIRGRKFGGNSDRSVSDGAGISSCVTAASGVGAASNGEEDGCVTAVSLDMKLAPKSELDLTLHL